MNDLHDMSLKARAAFYGLSAAPADKRNSAMLAMAQQLQDGKLSIFSENAADIAEAEETGLAAPEQGDLQMGGMSGAVQRSPRSGLHCNQRP